MIQKGGAAPEAPAAAAAPAEEEKKKGGKKKLIILVLLLAIGGGAAYYFLVMSKSEKKATACDSGKAFYAERPVQVNGKDVVQDGKVVMQKGDVTCLVEGEASLPVEATYLNLADGKYLKFGFTLQGTADATKETLSGAKASEIAITMFSQMNVKELAKPGPLIEEFKEKVIAAYIPEDTSAKPMVYEVNVTSFVTQ